MPTLKAHAHDQHMQTKIWSKWLTVKDFTPRPKLYTNKQTHCQTLVLPFLMKDSAHKSQIMVEVPEFRNSRKFKFVLACLRKHIVNTCVKKLKLMRI